MFKDKTKNIIEDSLKSAKFLNERERMKEASKEIDYYTNNQMDYILSEISRLRTDISSSKYATYLPLTNQIIDEISVMFSSGMNYELRYENDNIADKNNSTLAKLTKSAKLLSVLSDVNIYTNLNGTSGVLVDFDNETQRVSLRLITKDMFFVEQNYDDPTKIEALYVYLNPLEDTPNRIVHNGFYTKITSESIVEVKVDFMGGTIQSYETTRQDNPLGVIPFVLFNKQTPINSIYSNVRNPLPELNLQINLEISRLYWIEEFQAFSPLVLINGNSSSIEYGANKIIMLNDMDGSGQTMDAKFISPNISFVDLDELILRHMVRAGQLMGVGSSAYREGSTYSSGYQLRLAKEDIVRLNRKQRSLYTDSTIELIEMMIRVNNTYTTNTIDEGYTEVSVEIKDPQFDISQQEQEESYARRIHLGLTSAIEILSDELDISEDEATVRYNKIIEQNRLGRETPGSMFDSIRDFEE